MRLDRVLYVIAIIFFISTIAAVAYTSVTQQVWVVSTVVVGLAFVGLGYSQRPKTAAPPAVANVSAPPPPTSPPPQQQQPQQEQPIVPVATPSEPTVMEPAKTEEVIPIIEQPQPVTPSLTEVKGIGPKRETQLKALGINTIEDLAKASPEDLASKLNISPKITSKWIEGAKQTTRS